MRVTHPKTNTKRKKKPTPAASKILRRSFALPRRIVDEATDVAPGDLKGNLNRLVTTALQEYTKARRRQTFEDAMGAMAADPAIQKVSEDITRVFRTTEADGLPDD